MMLSKQHTILVRFIFILLLVVSVWMLTSMGRSKEIPSPADDSHAEKSFPVYPSIIPEELEFAGENVPLDFIDAYESLDRELLVNQYWHSQTILFIKRANRFFPVIQNILKKHNIPDDFKYLPVAESGLTNVTSPSGAVGIWQFLEGTAKDYGLEINDEVDERYHLEKATEAACRFLIDSFEIYGTWTMAAASYNAGRNGINKQIGRQDEKNYYDLLLSEETARYIFRILALKLVLSDPGKYGFVISEKDLYPEIPYFEVTVDDSVDDFSVFAKRYGISYKTLKWMNPWLRETKLTNRSGKTYYIKIPRQGFFRNFEIDNSLLQPTSDAF